MKIFHLCLNILNILVVDSFVYNNSFYYHEGWIPISNEEAYRRSTTNLQKPTGIQSIDIWKPTDEYSTDNINELKNNAIKLVKPQQVFHDFITNRERISHPTEEPTEPENQLPRKINGCDSRHSANCSEIVNPLETHSSSNYFKATEKLETLATKSERRAKKIAEYNNAPDNTNNPLYSGKLQEDNSEIKQKAPAEKHNTEDYTKTYEVTESFPTLDSFNAEPSEIEKNVGYAYNPPGIANVERKNSSLTKVFFNILSKYNINSGDELHNYERSRTPNPRDVYKPNYVFVPIPAQYFPKHNILNPSTVNPLLAVLLSNYGYYLPGSYGLHNSYRNLYGYLASNNIHNNKPFGSYKLFSDTNYSKK